MEFLCWSDENILELESGDGCIAYLGTYYKPLHALQKAELYGI